MPSLAESVAGIPIPADEIRAALQSAALPGYSGVVQVELYLKPEAASCVMFSVIRRQKKRPPGEDEQKPQRHTLPDPTRKKPVENVLEALRSKLVVRTVALAIEAHFLDGVLQNYTISE